MRTGAGEPWVFTVHRCSEVCVHVTRFGWRTTDVNPSQSGSPTIIDARGW